MWDEDHADINYVVIQQLAGGNAAVLGHAFGNGVARLLATSHGEAVKGTILAAANGSGVSKEVNETPFIAGNPSLPEQDRLAASSLAFFAPNHDARQWLTGWYPETLHMQKTGGQAVNPADFSRAGTAPILQIIAESDPWNPYSSWRELREQCGDRVTTRIVADASHALFPEQTPIVAEIVIAWLQSLGGTAEQRQSFHLKKRRSQMAENSDFGTFGRYQETPINEIKHQVPQKTFDQAKAMFGIRGIVDMLFLAGCCDTVCSLLNTFEVSVPENHFNQDKPAPDSARRR
jgi:hypothetical protein